MPKFEKELIENPIIAAVREEDLDFAVLSRAAIVFVLYGDILNIPDICSKIREKNKMTFIHVDLIDGLKGDFAGVKYIKHCAKPTGIISTKSSTIRYGNQLNLLTIQRIFMLDSLSLKTGIKSIRENNPDALEVLPGIASKIIGVLKRETKIPIIAGGLIKEKRDIMESLSAGAIGTAGVAW